MEKNQQIWEDDGRIARPKRLNWQQWLASVLLAALLVRSTWRFAQTAPQSRLDTRWYDGESIEWTHCATNNGHDLECASINVPMDHFDEANSGNETFSIPLIRLRGSKATRNLLVNPGGPGGSGIEFVFRLGSYLKSIVGDDLHIVGFDPRGVNGSRPAALCYPDTTVRTQQSQVCVSDPAQYNAETYAWTENFVHACEDTTGTQHVKYINTPQTAADMNSILDALGQEDMVYWGFSYGTLLGQTYASMFPERSDRVVIDGVVNLFDWYDGLITDQGLVDAENTLAAFFEKCITERDACPLSFLADDASTLQHKVMSSVEKLRTEPADVYLSNKAYGTLTYHVMLQAIWIALLKPKEWWLLADSLTQLVQGNATTAFQRYGQGYFAAEMLDHNTIISSNDHITGKDNWPQKRQLLDLLQPFINGSIFAPSRVGSFYLMSQWRVPTTHRFTPRRSVSTKRPLLILSQTYDPTTPLVSARVARDVFEGSRLVECLGAGHCSSAIHSSCSDALVRQFLVNGTLPEDDVRCEVDGKFFVNPEKQKEIVARAERYGASDKERLLAAQLKLADRLPSL